MSKLYDMKPYGALPCSLEVFTIKGKDANTWDFGEGEDMASHRAERWACGDHRFQGKMPTEEILKYYDITLSEYAEIVDALEDVLHVGACGWCI